MAPAPGLGLDNSKNKIDDNGGEQRKSQHAGTDAVIEATLPALANTFGSPVEGEEGVDHGRHSNEREQAGRDTADRVTKVEKTNGQPTKNDGEVQP